MASETLASVILPRPDSERKTALNFSVNDSNTALNYHFLRFFRLSVIFMREIPAQQTTHSKVGRGVLQGENPCGWRGEIEVDFFVYKMR